MGLKGRDARDPNRIQFVPGTSGPTIVVTLTAVFAIVATTSALVHARLRGR